MKPHTPNRSGGDRKPALAVALPVVIAFVCAVPARAQTNLVRNGDFSQLSVQSSAEFGTVNNGYTPKQQITDWTTAGYNFVFLPKAADTTGATGQYSALKLWGPGDGSNNTPTGGVSVESSPTGGNYVGADGAYEVSAITQTITGLTVGTTYAVSFAWAGAQQYGSSYTSATTEQLKVSLGGSIQSTQIVKVPGKGFSGWMNQTFDYVATSSSEVLSFLAAGTPSGQPPFALLANVSMTNAPEPTGLLVMLPGVVCILGLARRRRAPRNHLSAEPVT